MTTTSKPGPGTPARADEYAGPSRIAARDPAAIPAAMTTQPIQKSRSGVTYAPSRPFR